MLRVLEQLGYDLDALLSTAGLRREDVEDPGRAISPSACAAVFAAALRERRLPNLPLQLAVHTPVGTTPLLDYLIVSSNSVGQGLERLAGYLRLVNPGIRLVIHEGSDPVRVVVERARGAFETELTVALSILRFRRETDEQLHAVYASFTHEPGDVASTPRCWGARFTSRRRGMGGRCRSRRWTSRCGVEIRPFADGSSGRRPTSSRACPPAATHEMKCAASCPAS